MSEPRAEGLFGLFCDIFVSNLRKEHIMVTQV